MSIRPSRLSTLLALALVIAACTGAPTATTPVELDEAKGGGKGSTGKGRQATPGPQGTPSPRSTRGPSETPTPGAPATPIVVPSGGTSTAPADAPAPTVVGDYTAQVLDPTGAPVSGATVRGFVVDGDGAIAVEGKTDENGRFKLADAEGRLLNFEIVKADLKGFLTEVQPKAAGLQAAVRVPGSIEGRVTAPEAPTLADFSGVAVRLPGTPYTATVAADGLYKFEGVPDGTFSVSAAQDGLGSGRIFDLAVKSGLKTGAPELALDAAAPVPSALSATSGGEGFELTINGARFGTGALPTVVAFAGTAAQDVKVVNDTTIVAKVPAGAASGDVTVKVGPLAGAAGLPFKVLKSLVLRATSPQVLVGGVQPFTVEAKDAAGQVIADPGVDWATVGPAIRVANGLVTGLAAGDSTLRVQSGGLADQVNVKVVPFIALVSTFAGAGQAGGTNGVGTAAKFNAPFGLVANGGDLFVAEWAGNRVRRIKPDGTVSTVAGAASPGFVDQAGVAARFASPVGLAFAGTTLLVGDTINNRVRAIAGADPATAVTTRAGDGETGLTNGAALAARFSQPHGLAVDGAGNVFIADTFSHCIRRLDGGGQVTTWAGTGAEGVDNGARASATFRNPVGLALDAAGDLYVADQGNHCIRRIKLDGTVETFAGEAGTAGFADGASAVARFAYPAGLAFDAKGRLLVADASNHAVRRVAADGTVTTVAGSGNAGVSNGLGASATFREPGGVAVDAAGAIFVADRGNHLIRKVTLQEAP